MGKRISWAEPLITLEVQNSWPAIRQVPIPKDGLSYGKKSIKYDINNNNYIVNGPNIYKNQTDLVPIKVVSPMRYSFIIIIMVLSGLFIFYRFLK
jgi:hypothetical protein